MRLIGFLLLFLFLAIAADAVGGWIVLLVIVLLVNMALVMVAALFGGTGRRR